MRWPIASTSPAAVTDKTDARELVLKLDRYLQGNLRAMTLVHVPTAVEEQLDVLTKQVEALAPKVRPKGLGPLTLGTLIAELCNWSRFKNRKQIGSYTGLCGGVSSSGQSHCDLSINKAGNARVRWALETRLLQSQGRRTSEKTGGGGPGAATGRGPLALADRQNHPRTTGLGHGVTI